MGQDKSVGFQRLYEYCLISSLIEKHPLKERIDILGRYEIMEGVSTIKLPQGRV